MSIFKVCNFS